VTRRPRPRGGARGARGGRRRPGPRGPRPGGPKGAGPAAATPAAPVAPSDLPVVRVKSGRGSPHPWVWRSMVDARASDRAAPGAVVRVEDRAGEFQGHAFWHPTAGIALRYVSFDPDEAVDAAFFRRRLAAALALRTEVLRLGEETDAYRLCHAEADSVSGLVVDVLGGVVRVEVFAHGVARQAAAIRAALGELLPDRPVVLRADARSGELEGFDLPPGPDEPDEVEVTEHGVRYKVDLRHGHKTGFFCDQRDNRAFLAGLCRGRRVLDVCCYTGGFALNAAVRGEAAEVTGVDLDEKAVAVAKRNAKLNQVRVKFAQSDAFPYLRQVVAASAERRPEVLVLDPPKLARDRKERDDALRTYGDLNRLALEALGEEGLLLTCSCSGVVSEEDLLDVLRRSAARTGREVTILRLAGAGPDHPVALHAPEGRYLKAVFARVRRL